MEFEVCRLCLSKDELSPLFTMDEQNVRFATILAQTTGLDILPNDGLPQQICAKCTELVNKSIQLRNQSQIANNKLQQLLLEATKIENTTNFDLEIQNDDQKEHFFENFPDDCFGFDGFKIEVEMDRISQDGDQIKSAEAIGSIQPMKQSRKEKREIYMSMVEGELNPKGPIKCKICKKSVSKWVCFTNHAKKHLGFKVICEFCGKGFISSNQLKRHCRSYHGLERELKCRHCSYLALDKAQLVVHERRVHTGERPFVCDECAASYFSRKCLLQHIESHRTAASVQCDQCQGCFKSRRHLAKHKYAAHSDKRRARRRQKRLAQKQETGV